MGRSLLLSAGIICLAACASPSPNRVELPSELPTEVSAELQQKFAIKDTAAALPPSGFEWATIPPVSAEAAKKPVPVKAKRKPKKGATPAPAAQAETAPAPFVYPSRRPAKDPIWPDEKAVYDITYFGMSAGDFTLSVLPYKAINNRKVYHIRGVAVTSSVFSMFYRLNDMVETYIDYDGVFSQRFHILLDETKQTRDALELNDSEKKQTFYWNRWNRKEQGYTETKDFQTIAPFSQDSLSALYYLRTLPLQVGDVYTFPVISEGKSWDAEATVIRKEYLETCIGRVETVVVKPETKYQGILQKRGDSFIWFTNDSRHLVMRLEAKVKVGTVVARLKKIELGEAPSGN